MEGVFCIVLLAVRKTNFALAVLGTAVPKPKNDLEIRRQSSLSGAEGWRRRITTSWFRRCVGWSAVKGGPAGTESDTLFS